jgi:ParB/RepB/Spo0J family partition protein
MTETAMQDYPDGVRRYANASLGQIAHSPRYVEVLAVKCVQCGRQAGQLVDRRFIRDRGARPVIIQGNASRCGACGGNLLLERAEMVSRLEATRLTVRHRAAELGLNGRGMGTDAYQRRTARTALEVNCDDEGQPNPEVRVAWLDVRAIAETPALCNSRMHYDESTLDELVASIREHGILQPILVRPLSANTPGMTAEEPRAAQWPAYVVIAGNRRLLAGRRAGLSFVPCTILVTDADGAFVLNLVENLQRRELSGRERVRALSLLAGLTDAHGRTLGVRDLSRRTGLATGTISAWLRIDRKPVLKAALEEERLDIARAMALVSAPDRSLPGLIERANCMSQRELGIAVAAARRSPDVVADWTRAVNERRARAAYDALLQIDSTPEPVCELLLHVRQRLNQLLAADTSLAFSN